jgi:DTW domain-containing protein YfiP
MLKMCTGCHEKFLSCLCIDCSEMKIERYLLVEYPDEIEETIKTKIILRLITPGILKILIIS